MKQLSLILITSILFLSFQQSQAQLAIGIGSLGFSGDGKQEVKLSGGMRIGVQFPLIQPIILSESFGGFLVIKPGITWEKLHFQENLIVVSDTRTSFLEDVDKNHEYRGGLFSCKTSMQSSSISVPAEIYFPINKKREVFGSFGGFVNYKIDGKFKRRYFVDGEKHIDKDAFKLKDNPYHINRLQYGISASLTYKIFTLYGKYHLTSYFNQDKGPNIHMVEFGLFMRII